MPLFQAFFNNFIPDHDPDVFNPPAPERLTPLDQAALAAFEGYKRWDGVYFLHIAEHGYTYENCLAFFPLFPLLVQLTADSILFPLQYVMNLSSVLLIAASILNFWFFIQAAKVFYRLSVCVLRDETLAFKAAQLFCINPASIFFSACYTESLYCLLTLCGMLQFEKKNFMNSAFFFALSGAARSNGIVNLGFLLYAMGSQFLGQMKSVSRADFPDKTTKGIGFSSVFILTLVPIVFYTVVCLVPFMMFQVYGYTLFCNPSASARDLKAHILTYGDERGYKMAHNGMSPYCDSWIQLPYSYVQKHHWDVGFLSYYEYKQMPNFMLAGPMIALCLGAIGYYSNSVLPRFFNDATGKSKKDDDVAAKLKKDDDLSKRDTVEPSNNVECAAAEIPKGSDSGQNVAAGLDLKERKKTADKDAKGEQPDPVYRKSNEDAKVKEEKKMSNEEDNIGLNYFCHERLLVYVVHLLFLTIVAVFFMHVQVNEFNWYLIFKTIGVLQYALTGAIIIHAERKRT